MEIVLAITLLLAVPMGLIVYSFVASPGPYEQVEAMMKDPKLRARTMQLFSARRWKIERGLLRPIPRLAVPITELANDRSEEQLLADLRDEPRDDATRMVYADWLEQRSELVKASFLRHERVERDLLMATTDVAWRAVVSHAKVPEHSCELVRWSELQAVAGDPLVRECPYCKQPVRYCNNTADQQAAHAREELAILDTDTRF